MTNLDRTVTYGLLMAVVLETASILFWAGSLNNRVESLELYAELGRPINSRLTRLEEQVTGIRDMLQRIETELVAMEGHLQ